MYFLITDLTLMAIWGRTGISYVLASASSGVNAPGEYLLLLFNHGRIYIFIYYPNPIRDIMMCVVSRGCRILFVDGTECSK